MVPVLSVKGLSKRYGRAPALRDVDLAVYAGECVGLAGVNGAGKTTLIKCVLDFSAADSGTAELFGIASREPRARARLAYLPERFAPPYYFTGNDFLRYVAQLRGMTFDAQAIAEIVHSIELDPNALARPVRTYSKGMTQKLGLAAVFLSSRDLLILDEPMSGLDPRARARVKRLLVAERERGATVFFTSHSLADIAELCDRMVVLHRGVPYFAGTPRQLCQDFGEGKEPSFEDAFLRCIEAQPHDG